MFIASNVNSYSQRNACYNYQKIKHPYQGKLFLVEIKLLYLIKGEIAITLQFPHIMMAQKQYAMIVMYKRKISPYMKIETDKPKSFRS